MNELMNVYINEWMDDWIIQWINEWMNELMHEWMHERFIKSEPSLSWIPVMVRAKQIWSHFIFFWCTVTFVKKNSRKRGII